MFLPKFPSLIAVLFWQFDTYTYIPIPYIPINYDMPIYYIPSYDHLNHGNGKANHWPNSPWVGEEIGFTTGARAQYAGAALGCFTVEQPTVGQFQSIPKPCFFLWNGQDLRIRLAAAVSWLWKFEEIVWIELRSYPWMFPFYKSPFGRASWMMLELPVQSLGGCRRSFCTVQSPGWLVNVRFSRDRELVLIKSNYTLTITSLITLQCPSVLQCSLWVGSGMFQSPKNSYNMFFFLNRIGHWRSQCGQIPGEDDEAFTSYGPAPTPGRNAMLGWKVNWWTPNG